MGADEPRGTPFSLVKEAADLIVAGGLKAEALHDARPAQWSKLIFNSSVNAVSALTGLPHSPHFAEESQHGSLGHLIHGLIEEGKQVAKAAGIELLEDPWELNKIGAMTNDQDLDALVVRAPDNVVYLSNYWCMKGYDALVFPREGEPTLIALEPQLAEAQRNSWTKDIRLFKGYDEKDPRPPQFRSL